MITANRGPLERAFGVDLIYINTVRRNVVMVQHKMLEPSGSRWLYKPNKKLGDEIGRMERFTKLANADSSEYRLHPGVFYLKFVKRDARIRAPGLLLPLSRYKTYIKSPESLGPKGTWRIDYEGLAGRYMREQPFVDLFRAGYIGSYSRETDWLRTIVEAILKAGNAIVAAIHTGPPQSGSEHSDE